MTQGQLKVRKTTEISAGNAYKGLEGILRGEFHVGLQEDGAVWEGLAPVWGWPGALMETPAPSGDGSETTPRPPLQGFPMDIPSHPYVD